MRVAFFLFLMFIGASASSQFLQYASGEPFLTKSYEEYKGSPFMFEDWVMAKVTTSKGTTYDSMFVNLDLYAGNLLFLRDGKAYTFAEPIAEFSVANGKEVITYKKGRRFHGTLPDLFFTQISTNPLLFKTSTVDLLEAASYGSATKQYRFAQGKSIYDVSEGTGVKVNLTKNDAEKVFKKHWPAISAFASKNRISFKTEEGWAALATHYQTLE